MSVKVLCDLCTTEIPKTEDDNWSNANDITVGGYKTIDACKPCIEWVREELLQKRIKEQKR